MRKYDWQRFRSISIISDIIINNNNYPKLTNKYNNLGLSNLNSLKHMDKHNLLHWGAQL